MREAKSARSRKGLLAPDRHQMFDRLTAHPLHRGERIEDRPVGDVEILARAIDRRGLDPDAEPHRLAAEIGQFVGVRHVERHGRGEELDGIVRLHVGGVIGDQRIGGGVRLVEAVVGEFGEQVEDRVGVVLGQPLFQGAVDEADALGVHLRLDLLAHGAAQQIGFAERIAGQDLGDLHHLFLVDDDAEGLLQHRLQQRMHIVGRLQPPVCGHRRPGCWPSVPAGTAPPAR